MHTSRLTKLESYVPCNSGSHLIYVVSENTEEVITMQAFNACALALIHLRTHGNGPTRDNNCSLLCMRAQTQVYKLNLLTQVYKMKTGRNKQSIETNSRCFMHISSFERAKREAGGPQVQIANAMGNPDNDFTIGINACNATTNQIAVVDMFANA